MTLYAESSAVLAWLLGEPGGHHVRDLLQRAQLVMASDLLLIECDRVLIRAVTFGDIPEAAATERRFHLNAAAARWHIFRLGPAIVERARRPFRDEPIRGLDAIHLASALAARSAIPDVELLTLDQRIRQAAKHLGFMIQPA